MGSNGYIGVKRSNKGQMRSNGYIGARGQIRVKYFVIIPFPIFSNFSSDGYFAVPGVSLILFPFLFTALTSISIKLFSPIRNGTFDSGTSGVPF